MTSYVYLCSRIAQDARWKNGKVAKSLKKAGFEVYVPHEQKPNNPAKGERFDAATIFEMDYAAMQRADHFVVVGRQGKDMSWEIGWAYARGVPVHFVPFGDEAWRDSPMLLPALSEFPPILKPSEAGDIVKERDKARTSPFKNSSFGLFH